MIEIGVVDRLRGLFTGKPDSNVTRMQLVTEYGDSFYAWNGKLYESDIIRAAIRPKTQAIGKIVGKHIRDGTGGFSINPDPTIRRLLETPNPYMSGQMLQEKMANQLALNGNAFALVIRDQYRTAKEIFPISAAAAEAVYGKSGEVMLRFTMLNGDAYTFPYSDVIHLRRDFYDGSDMFGGSQVRPLTEVMNVVGTIDKGIIQAVKNSGMVRWLLTFNRSIRDEDLKQSVKEFVDNYLSIESDTFGAAGVDAKCDAKQITPTDIMPNAKLTEQQVKRVYAFFNTNERIVTSSYTEEEWNSYYESEVSPVIIQFSNAWTDRLFTARERGCGNRIVFESSNLQFANLKTKLQLVQFFDRGIMNANEIRELMNLSPVEGGDRYYVRLDTAPTDGGGEPDDE